MELAETIIDLTGSGSTIITAALPDDDPVQRCPDITLAEEKLNWKPSTPLKTGLEQTIAYFDRLLAEAP